MIDSRDFLLGRMRARLIAVLTADPAVELHTRELVRRTGGSPRAVHVALEQLERQGVISSRRIGGLRLWSASADSPLFRPLQELAKRTLGVPILLRKALAGQSGVDLAFIYGSYALGTEDASSDIDVFLLGNPEWRGVAELTRDAKQTFGRDVNVIAWTAEQLTRARSDPFLRSVRKQPKIWLIGKEGDLERRTRSMVSAARRVGSTRQGEPKRRTKEAATRRAQSRTSQAEPTRRR